MLNEYDKTYDDLEIIAINLTQNDSEAKVLELIENNDYEYSMIMDKDGSRSAPYRIQYIPFVVLLDENGAIQYKGSAPRDISGLRTLINE